MGDQGGVDARLQRRAVTHQVEAKAGPLALGAYARGRQPDGRHQVTAGQLGQQVGVDAGSVLAVSGARPLTFAASASATSQPQASSASCTKRALFIDSMAA